VQQQQHRCLVALSICQVSEPQPAPFCSHLGPANVPDALATLANDFIESTEAYPHPIPNPLDLNPSIWSLLLTLRVTFAVSSGKLAQAN